MQCLPYGLKTEKYFRRTGFSFAYGRLHSALNKAGLYGTYA